MRNRPSKIQWYMNLAEVAAQRSHDEDTQVGALLYDKNTGAVVALSYNGHVRDAPQDLPSTRPDKYRYFIHAEQNLITNCAHQGINMSNCVVVCTMTPCEVCTRLLYQCGITDIYAKEIYKDFFEHVLAMRDIQVKYEKTEEGFAHVQLSSKSDTSGNKCFARRRKPRRSL